MKLIPISALLALGAALLSASAAQAAIYEFGAFTSQDVSSDSWVAFTDGTSAFDVLAPSHITLTVAGDSMGGFVTAASAFSTATLIDAVTGAVKIATLHSNDSRLYSATFDLVDAGTYHLAIGASGDSVGGGLSGAASITAVPEPATLGFSVLGVLGVIGLSRASKQEPTQAHPAI
jgi:uncharacterized protein YaiE (UPF0345 family)